MSDIGGLVDELIAAGTPPGMAAQIVARAFAAGVASADFRGHSTDVSAERRREKDRIRKQDRRESLRKSADVCGNPQMSQNASLSNQEKIEDGKEERGASQRSVRGQRLPENWQPTPQDQATAHELIGAQRTTIELEKYRDHWKQQPGSKGVKLDWNAAWRNWIRRSAEYRGGTANGRRTVHDAARDLHEQTVAAVLAFDEPAPGGLRDGTGPNPVRLLPARRCE